MKDQALNGKDAISVINVLHDFKWTCNSPRIQKGDTVCIFWEVINGATFAAIKLRLTLSFNDENRNEGFITTYAGVVNHSLSRYGKNEHMAMELPCGSQRQGESSYYAPERKCDERTWTKAA